MGKDFLERALATSQTAFEAGCGEARWETAVADLVQAFGGEAGVIFNLNRETGEITNWHEHALPQTTQYIEEMNAINPRMHYSMAQKSTHCVTDLQLIDGASMRRHEFYRWMETHNRLQHFIGGRILDDGPISTFLSVEFDHRSAPPGLSDVDYFGMIGQHFANAQRWQKSAAKNDGSGARMDDFLANATTTALMFLDRKGRFLFCNPAGDALLGHDPRLSLENSRVSFSNSHLNRQYQQRLVQLVDSEIDDTLNAPWVGHMQGNYPHLPLLVRLMPMPHPMLGSGGKTAHYCVFIQSGSPQDGDGHAMMLCTLFDLTNREAEFAVAFCTFHSMTIAAESCSMSLNTARVHMHRVLKKMNIHRQTQLVETVQAISSWH